MICLSLSYFVNLLHYEQIPHVRKSVMWLMYSVPRQLFPFPYEGWWLHYFKEVSTICATFSNILKRLCLSPLMLGRTSWHTTSYNEGTIASTLCLSLLQLAGFSSLSYYPTPGYCCLVEREAHGCHPVHSFKRKWKCRFFLVRTSNM